MTRTTETLFSALDHPVLICVGAAVVLYSGGILLRHVTGALQGFWKMLTSARKGAAGTDDKENIAPDHNNVTGEDRRQPLRELFGRVSSPLERYRGWQNLSEEDKAKVKGSNSEIPTAALVLKAHSGGPDSQPRVQAPLPPRQYP